MSLICWHYNDEIENLDMKILYASFCGFNILGVLDLQGGQNFCFPIDFAGDRYNSAASGYCQSKKTALNWLKDCVREA